MKSQPPFKSSFKGWPSTSSTEASNCLTSLYKRKMSSKGISANIDGFKNPSPLRSREYKACSVSPSQQVRDFSPSIVVKIGSLRHDLRVMTPARLNEQTDRLSHDKNGANGHSSSHSAGYHFVPTDFDLVYIVTGFALQWSVFKNSFLYTGVIIRFINHLPFLRKVTGTPIIAPQELHDWCRWLLCFCFTSQSPNSRLKILHCHFLGT